MKQRDISIDILKGIGIILVVLGHSGCPDLVRQYIYTFHMPLFFLASGYFFSEKNLDEKKSFFIKKVKGIYVPFLIASLSCLLLHNFFFKLGIINGVFGDVNGPSALYSLKEILFRASMILIRMDRYDSFLLGAYWFMRTLFLGFLIICFGGWAVNLLLRSVEKSILAVSLICFAGGGVIRFFDVDVPLIPRGGYYELIGAFFIGVGYLLRKRSIADIQSRIPLFVAIAVSLVLFILYPASMDVNLTIRDWIFIPFSGIAVFYIIFRLSQKWTSFGGKFMAYIGEKSIWILTFHFICFKISELLEIRIYGLPSEMIGCHPVIPPQDNFFFVIHTITAVAFPVLIAYVYSKMKINR